MLTKEKIIVALDVPSADAALQLSQKLHGHVGIFKVGSQVFTADGPVVARFLVATGKQVFLDLKFHDIPNTVRAAAHRAGMLGASLLTVHASGGRKMMEAAVEGACAAAKERGAAQPTRVLAVTALTSLGPEDLAEVGFKARRKKWWCGWLAWRPPASTGWSRRRAKSASSGRPAVRIS